MTALVTGGAGFIGSNLVRELLRDGGEVIVLDDFSTGRRENLPTSSRLTIVDADLATFADLPNLVSRSEFVFHLAAQVGIMRSLEDPVRDATSNVLGTVRLLDACRDTPVRKVVCSVSAAVFGEIQATPIAEHHPQRPQSFYALSKMASERYAVLAASLHGVPTVCLRYFNVFGLPFADNEYAGVIPAFIGALRRDERLVIYGDGLQDRDFVYVKDVVAANLAAARLGGPGTVYNIGTGRSTSVLDLARILGDLAGRQPRIDFQAARPGEVRHSVAAIDLARAELGYAPAFDLRTGLRDVWDQIWPVPARPD